MNSRKHARLRKIQKRRQLEARVRRLFGYLAPAFEKEFEERFTNLMLTGTTHPEHMGGLNGLSPDSLILDDPLNDTARGGTFSNVANDLRPDLTVEAIVESMDRIMALPLEPRFIDPAQWLIKEADDIRERFNWITRL